MENLNDAHRLAAVLYHGDSDNLVGKSPSQGCINCHDSDSSSAWKQATEELPLTFKTHASHPIGKRIIPGSGPLGNRIQRHLDTRIPLFDGRMECQSCHDLTAPTKDLLIAFAEPKQLCLGCHQLKGSKDPVAEDSNSTRPVAVATTN